MYDEGSHECDFDLERGLGMFQLTKSIERIILGNDWRYGLALIERDQFRRFFPNLQEIMITTTNDWAVYLDTKYESEALFRAEWEVAGSDFPFATEPSIHAIRPLDVLNLYWHKALTERPVPHSHKKVAAGSVSPYDGDQTAKSTHVNFLEWADGLCDLESELSYDEVGACLQDFCRLPDEQQIHHLKRFFNFWGEDGICDKDGQARYLRQVYGMEK